MSEAKPQVPAIAGPRLPYHPAVQERFGISVSDWKVLTEAIFPAAKTPEAVILALAYCKSRNLDPMKRPVHIVPIWDKQRGALVETVWPGIAELRTTAARTGQYAGRDATEFGPVDEHTFPGVTIAAPGWARVTVYRIVGGNRCQFIGPQVWFGEAVNTKKDGTPTEMWARRPWGQLEKCAEAAALRMAFPEEIGGDMAAEEVTDQALPVMPDVPHRATRLSLSSLPNPPLAEPVPVADPVPASLLPDAEPQSAVLEGK